MKQFQQNLSEKSWNKNQIARIILIFSFTLILGFILTAGFNLIDDKNDSYKRILDNVFPLIATWVGAVIAYYFGRENFDAATKQYESIIKRLSPDVLDDVLVDQIMIDKDTMLYKNFTDIPPDSEINEISEFMKNVKKSRLPILENGKIKYIIHQSSFDRSIASNSNSEIPVRFSQFLKENDKIKLFEVVPTNSRLEIVLQLLKKNPDIKDVFVEKDNITIGWLPDSLIQRYLMT